MLVRLLGGLVVIVFIKGVFFGIGIFEFLDILVRILLKKLLYLVKGIRRFCS